MKIFSQEQPMEEGWTELLQQQQQALSILGGTGYQRGVEAAETGLNAESFEVRYFPEVNEDLQGIGGETFVTAKSTAFSRDISVNGEVNGSTGLMAAGLTAAVTVANDIATFGATTGTVLLDDVTETQNRGAWRAAAFKLSSKPNRVLA